MPRTIDYERAVEFLKQHPEQPFTTYQVFDHIFTEHRDEYEQKMKDSSQDWTKESYIKKLTSDVFWLKAPQMEKALAKDNPNAAIVRTATRPFKVYYTTGGALDNSNSAPCTPPPTSTATDSKQTEHDLYPKLTEFLKANTGNIPIIHTKRIDETRSKNDRGRGGNHWLYPDVVGLENVSEGWHNIVKECTTQFSDKQVRLWSFEVKKELTKSNVRESFFQSVSNSSWAHFGYLVAARIDESIMPELRILSAAHGVGVLSLDAEDMDNSHILIPAHERTDVDWDTVNRIAEQNKDFRHYVGLITEFHKIGKIKPHDWD